MPATVTYPLAVTAGLEVTRINRVLADTFEDGSGSARRLWADRTFKRRFRIQHAPLLATELDALEGFYSRRNGPYDSFWFRDNVFRRGNAEVRFAGPLRIAQSRGVRTVEVELEEIAPIVQNPTLFELRTVLQMTPLWWWDANRALFYRHVDPASLYFESAVDCTVGTHKPVWLPGGVKPYETELQWQSFRPALTYYARTTGNVALSGGTQPGFTLFAFVRNSTSSTKQVIAAVGTPAAGNALGLVLSSANVYEPWVGGTETWATAVQSNAPENTWRSVAVSFAAGSDSVEMIVNGAAVGATTKARSYVAGPASLGASATGTNAMNTIGYLSSDVQHVMAFNSALSAATIKTLHNLFAYQFGLPLVP